MVRDRPSLRQRGAGPINRPSAAPNQGISEMPIGVRVTFDPQALVILQAVNRSLQHMTDSVANLTTAVASLVSAVDATVTELSALVAQIVAENAGENPAIDGLVEQINAKTAALTTNTAAAAAAAAVHPAPAPTPAPAA